MIIFIDDLASYGLTASELQPDGDSASRWPEVERSHLERIENTLQVLPRQVPR